MHPFLPQPKPKHKRRHPKRKKQGEFDPKTRRAIIARDKGKCVRCGAQAEEIHHIIFRSQGGPGTVDNGVCVCRKCHERAHSTRLERLWFELWRERLRKTQ